MQFFFGDDSKQSGARKGMGTVVAFGGIFFAQEHLLPFKSRCEEILAAAGVPDNEEVKWSPHRESWIYNNFKGREREDCYLALLRAAQSLGGRVIVVACEPERAGLKLEWGFERCLEYCLERISLHLKQTGNLGIVIADRPGGNKKGDEEFLSAALAKIEDDTNYIQKACLALPVLSAPSHLNRHLQIADLVTGITAAMVAGKSQFAGPLFAPIHEMMVQNTLGYVGGTGLKVYPDDLINLYHWVLGETEFSKASRMAAIPIPCNKIAYFENDGCITNESTRAAEAAASF